MNQYTDLFIEEGGGRGGRGGKGGKGGKGGRGGREGRGGARKRSGNEEYIYQGQEEDGFQRSPTSQDTRYGFGAVPITISRSNQQVRIPQHPMSSRQGGQNFPIPPVPRAPSNSSNGNRIPLPRPSRQNYVPSNLDPSEVQEVQQGPNFSYRVNEQPVRSQPGYSQQSDDDREHLSPTNRPSVSSSRSIFIGFDPSNPPSNLPSNPVAATNSLGVIPNFPPVPPPTASGANRKISGAGPPPSARRGTSSYYSQQALMVSPIAEESLSSLDRHGSYASSAAIPAGWGNSPMESYDRDDSLNDSDEYESRTPTSSDFAEERGLVRQASVGRKSKPIITEIRNSERSKSFDQGGSNLGSTESVKTGHSVGSPVSVARTYPRSPAEKSSPTLNPPPGSGSPLPSTFLGPQARSPASLSSSDSQVRLPFAFSTEDYIDEKSGFQGKASRSSSPNSEKEFRESSTPVPSWETTPTSIEMSTTAAGGRRIPPRLNLDAVREAEARGSLTSLPDLIKRATKLAAVLETGRPNSRWELRRSFIGRNNGRDTDSISDILASFPPPALAQGRRGTRTMSQWPLPDDLAHGGNSIGPSNKQGRRICGLPLWAFILLVILALLVISAAVIVPLQLVNLSKGNSSKNSDSSTVAQCKEKNPCLNGGENIAAKNFCGCVCTNGFTGSNCSQKDDLSCTTVDLKDQKSKGVSGIENVTMGNALPRLFDIADPLYNIELDMAVILAAFSNESVSCTAQNALVTFNGVAIPSTSTTNNGKRALADAIAGLEKRQNLVIAGTTTTTPTATGTASGSEQTRVPELDPDAVDFARVIVLYLTNAQTLEAAGQAQNALQTEFTAGRDFGNVSLGNGITLNFDNRSIILSGGEVVGSVNTNTTINSTTVSVNTRRFIKESYLDLLS